jgi:hypothetical protein
MQWNMNNITSKERVGQSYLSRWDICIHIIIFSDKKNRWNRTYILQRIHISEINLYFVDII